MNISPGPHPRLRIDVLAVVLVLTASAVGSCSHSPGPAACVSTAGPRTAASEPAASPSGALKVVEKGFTQLSDSRRRMVLGAVLQNTSSLVAYRIPVAIRVLDAAGRSIAHPISLRWLRQEIPVLMPGQRIGVAAVSDVIDDQRTGRPVAAAGFAIDLGTPQWWPREARGHTFAEVTARAAGTLHGSTSDSGGRVSFTAHSPYCDRLLRRGVATLFRNSRGALLGGSFAPDGVRAPDPASRQMCYTGTFTGFSELEAVPAKTDDSRTEIYPYCDIAEPPVPTPSSSTAPIN